MQRHFRIESTDSSISTQSRTQSIDTSGTLGVVPEDGSTVTRRSTEGSSGSALSGMRLAALAERDSRKRKERALGAGAVTSNQDVLGGGRARAPSTVSSSGVNVSVGSVPRSPRKSTGFSAGLTAANTHLPPGSSSASGSVPIGGAVRRDSAAASVIAGLTAGARPDGGAIPNASSFAVPPNADALSRKLASAGLNDTYVPEGVAADPMQNTLGPVIDLTDKRGFLTRPVPPGAMVQCRIVRDRSSFMLKAFPVFKCYLDLGNGDKGDFLMVARKRKKSKVAHFLISDDEDDTARASVHFLGKVKSNWSGTEYRMFDRGVNPEKAATQGNFNLDNMITSYYRQELASVLFETNAHKLAGEPRKMTVLLPRVSHVGVAAKTTAPESGSDLIARYRKGLRHDLVELGNKSPVWDEAMKTHVLDFGGRVTMASVKNFQLVRPQDTLPISPTSPTRALGQRKGSTGSQESMTSGSSSGSASGALVGDKQVPHDSNMRAAALMEAVHIDPEALIVQFGKVGDNEFTLDFQYPVTPLQAFGLALTSIDSKLACE